VFFLVLLKLVNSYFCHCVWEWMFPVKPKWYTCQVFFWVTDGMQHFQVTTTESSFAMASPCNDWRSSWEKDWQDYQYWRSFHQKSHGAESLLNFYMGEMSSLRRKPIISVSSLKNRLVWLDRIVCACDHSPDVVAYNDEQKRKKSLYEARNSLENYCHN
jgi:hypothetical protein